MQTHTNPPQIPLTDAAGISEMFACMEVYGPTTRVARVQLPKTARPLIDNCYNEAEGTLWGIPIDWSDDPKMVVTSTAQRFAIEAPWGSDLYPLHMKHFLASAGRFYFG